ncbi:MAG: HAMP domain-containing sensor histidine kinase [Pseudomonadota bacterium]
MTRLRHYHVIFALALLALAALGAWWTVFLNDAVHAERMAAMADMEHRAREGALLLGHQPRPPRLEDLPDSAMLELLPCDTAGQGFRAALTPLHAALCLRPVQAAVAEIDARLTRRRQMVLGEGSFLFLLLGVCTVMLWGMLRQERRQTRRMEAFVHAVTHEMKTPLTGIKSLLDTLRRRGVPEAMQERLLALGLENCERLEHSIENVIIAGALRAGQQQMRVISLPVAPFLEALLEHRHRGMPGAAHTLRLDWPEPDPALAVRVDPDLLRVVLENLLDNGHKYGGDHPVVTLRVEPGLAEVALTVSDRGVGFTPEQAESLFVPFLRALPRGHGVRHGTGLGLSIARDLCRRMGGDLRAHSAGPGQGARFTVTLPRGVEEEAT